jgi:acyl phosphate:glycerol-3-phosphate acyltransferase
MGADALLVPAGYLLGSIPIGYLLARRAGIDVRAVGSGNVGATNVARTAGPRLGLWTLVGDVLKGAIAVALARTIASSEAITGATAVAAVAGHAFPVFLGFRGGKGVATGLGVLLVLAPAAAPVPLVAFASAFALSRIVSLASLAAAVTAPIAIFGFGYASATVVAATVIAGLVVWRHAENLARIRAGTEARFRSRD